jgi:ATP synthase F1 gamma subunit
MAGVSTKEIKNRIRSMESTKQITKAMEMVAASKLRRAQAQVANSRPYFEILRSTIDGIMESNGDFSSPFLEERPVKKVMYIVIAGDRGLAGGYNSNILKLVESEIKGKDAMVLPIGKKSVDFFRSRKVPAWTENFAEAADVDIGDCFSIAKDLCKRYLAGEFDEQMHTMSRQDIFAKPPASRRIPLAVDQCLERASQTYQLCQADYPELGAAFLEAIDQVIQDTIREFLERLGNPDRDFEKK